MAYCSDNIITSLPDYGNIVDATFAGTKTFLSWAVIGLFFFFTFCCMVLFIIHVSFIKILLMSYFCCVERMRRYMRDRRLQVC